MLTIGITGGIGSGKSVATRMLAEMGAVTIDADKVAHSVYEPGGAAYSRVVVAFGGDILAPDLAIDRKKLGAIVFADPAALKRLTDIVWPRTFERMQEMVAELRARGERRPIVIEAAVLIEANWQPLCDEIWLVVAPRQQAIARLQRDRGQNPAETEARIKAQLSDDQRRKWATIVIENGGTMEELHSRVKKLWAEALKRNAAPET